MRTDVALIRDRHEERLTRLEHLLEQLRLQRDVRADRVERQLQAVRRERSHAGQPLSPHPGKSDDIGGGG